MKKLKLAVAVAVAAALPFTAHAAPATWTIDGAHSTTGFAVKHLVVSTVRGQFGKTSGTLHLDDADPSRSSVEAVVDASSIDTQNAQRDAHLASPDFLDVAKHPTITFRSTKVEPHGKDKLVVTGELTLHGVTKPAAFDVTASPVVKGMAGELRRAFSATTRIDRRDYGLRWSKAVEAGPVVGDEVTITLDLEATPEAPKSAAR